VVLFAQNKKVGVQSFVLKIVNNSCPELRASIEGPRLDRRVNLTIVVLIVPVEQKRLEVLQAFTAVTKEFSATGVGVVLDEPKALDDVILGFRWEAEMVFVRAKAKHLNPLGGGFYQLGFQMTEILPAGDYPQLRSLSF
jgi:hypothetical protein